MNSMQTSTGEIQFKRRSEALWQYRLAGSRTVVPVAAPVFEIDGVERAAVPKQWRSLQAPKALRNGTVEHAFEGVLKGDPDLALEIIFRVAADSPVVRFRYVLKARRAASRRLTKTSGKDRLSYLALSLAAWPECTQVRLSEFDESIHSFRLCEQALQDKEFDHGLAAMGPILTAGDGCHALLVAYEHGSQIPDAFLQYRLHAGRRWNGWSRTTYGFPQ